VVVVANGTIMGTVINASSGLAIENATVSADTQSNITDANGNYSISIAAGTYTVTANATGYQTNATTDVVVTSGNVTTQNFALIPAVVPTEVAFNISADELSKTTITGINATYMLTINNTGTAMDNYTLAVVDNPDGATANLSTNLVQNLAAGANTTILLNVTSTTEGQFRVNVTATSQGDATKNASVNTTTKVGIPPVTFFLLTSDTSVVLKGTTININVMALNGSLPQPLFNGMADITIVANNLSTVSAPINVSFVNGNATIHVTSGIAQFVNITATNGTITGSTIVEFADMVISLNRGYNLISIPSFANPSDTTQALQLVQNNGVQTFNPATGMFVTPTDFAPLYAYWINVTADNQKLGFIADSSVLILPPTRNLYEGWNLIGISASSGDAVDSIRLDMNSRNTFADLRNGDLPSEWMYSRLVSFDEATGRFTTYTAGVDLTLDLPALKQGHGYWMFIKSIPNTNKNNVPWAGKVW
jgi:hypothetical protein